jgi:ketosteroid isomerase-like protein
MKALVLLACLTALCACAPRTDKPRFNAAKVVDAIRADEVRWNADWKSGDAGKVVAHYAPDAVVMVPGAAPEVGIEAIRAGAQRSIDDPAFSLTFSSDKVDVAASGDLAASRGSFTEASTDPATKAQSKITGTFVTVYKPQPDGSWKALWDIATPGAAPAPAAK